MLDLYKGKEKQLGALHMCKGRVGAVHSRAMKQALFTAAHLLQTTSWSGAPGMKQTPFTASSAPAGCGGRNSWRHSEERASHTRTVPSEEAEARREESACRG